MAQKDVWMIGDNFVNETFHALPAMNTQARIDKRMPPPPSSTMNSM